MTLTIDPGDRRPIYQQIADGIKTLIAAGQLRPGDTLPPVRQLGADLGVNLNTIAAGYRELQNEGLIVLKHGSGATVMPLAAARRSEDDLRRSIRSAMTELVLAGMSRALIVRLVEDELQHLLKGAKT